MRSFEVRSDTHEEEEENKKNMPNWGNKQGSLHLPLVVKKMHARSLSTTTAKTAQQEVSGSVNSTLACKMENAGKAGLLCSIVLLFFSGNQIFATDIYTNIWAVKVYGGVQDAKKLAVKHGLSYERHVS